MEYNKARQLLLKYTQPDVADWTLAYILNISRVNLPTVKQITKKQFGKVKKFIKKYKKQMPLTLALGSKPFVNTTILVNRHVLSPRFETEELTAYIIDKILKENTQVKVLDLCCGSGAIAVAIKKDCESLVDVTASDISKKAVKTTIKNAKLNNVNITAIKSDMFKKISGKFNYIICNPPYIAYNDPQVAQDVNRWEPHLALYAPDNGYKFYKILSRQASDYLLDGGKLCLEVGHTMADTVAGYFKDNYYTEILKDINGVQRFVIVTKK